jgi:opacity protein-like surface antigen
MRKVLFFAAAAAASAVAIGSPASAQRAPHPAQPGYGAQHYGTPGYGYGRGHQAQVRQLHQRVEQLRRQINQLHRMNRLSNREARRLDAHAVELHRRIDAAARRGINRRERAEIEYRIDGLRHAIRYETRDDNRWGWNGRDRFDNPYGYYGTRRSDDDRRGRRGNRDDDDDDRSQRGRDRD